MRNRVFDTNGKVRKYGLETAYCKEINFIGNDDKKYIVRIFVFDYKLQNSGMLSYPDKNNTKSYMDWYLIENGDEIDSDSHSDNGPGREHLDSIMEYARCRNCI